MNAFASLGRDKHRKPGRQSEAAGLDLFEPGTTPIRPSMVT
jgi:hypothetical protein